MSRQRRWTRRGDATRAAGPARPGRHLAAVPDLPTGPQPETTTGSAALDGLLDEVRELRLTFVADLASAAGAVEAGAPDVAADIVSADRRELARFFRSADDQLRELERAAYRDEVSAPARSRARRRVAVTLPAIPLVGALTMAAAAASGILPVPGISSGPAHHQTSAAVVSGVPALTQFEDVVNGDPSAQQVIAAADKLHAQIVALIATSDGDPARANAIAQLLQMERALLLSKQPPGAQTVLAATRSLITQLASHTTSHVLTPLPTATSAVVAPNSTSTARATTSPKPTASSTKTAKPSPTPTHSSSPSPTPTSSPSSDSGPLPKIGG